MKTKVRNATVRLTYLIFRIGCVHYTSSFLARVNDNANYSSWKTNEQKVKERCQIVKRKFVWIIIFSNLHFLKQINCMKKPEHLLNVHSIMNVVFQNQLWRIIITSLINIHEGGNTVSFFLTEKILSMELVKSLRLNLKFSPPVFISYHAA